MNLAVVGAGRIGQLHARNIATRIADARLVAVADVNLAVAKRVAVQSGLERTTSDYHELLEDKTIDGVIICSGTDSHAQIIEEAAAAGKHIFCEKPIGLDLVTIQRALGKVAEAGVKLQVGFNRRFEPSFARIKQLVAAGRVGTPHIVRVTSRDPSPPPIEYVRTSGGLLLDMAIHDFDMVRFLTSQEVEEVYAIGSALIDSAIGQAGDVDTCVITMRLTGGAFATIDNSRKAVYGYDQRIEVFGSAGMVASGSPTLDGPGVLHTAAVPSTKPLPHFLERYQETFLIEMQEFVACIRNDRTPLVTGLDGLKSALISFAALKSLRENRPVALDEMALTKKVPVRENSHNLREQ